MHILQRWLFNILQASYSIFRWGSVMLLASGEMTASAQGSPTALCGFVQSQIPVIAECKFSETPNRQFQISLNPAALELMERKNMSAEAANQVLAIMLNVHFHAIRDRTLYDSVVILMRDNSCVELTKEMFDICVANSNGDFSSTDFGDCLVKNLQQVRCAFSESKNYSGKIVTGLTSEDPVKNLCPVVTKNWAQVSNCTLLPRNSAVYFEWDNGFEDTQKSIDESNEYSRKKFLLALATILENIRIIKKIDADKVIINMSDSSCSEVTMLNYLRCVSKPGGIQAPDFGNCLEQIITSRMCPQLER